MISLAVVDDNAYIAGFLKKTIASYFDSVGLQNVVDSYTSGIEFLKYAEKYVCVFLDIDMPDIGGYEVAKKIREQYPDYCIVMATGRVMDYKPAFELGIFRFITKPFDVKEIEKTLQGISLLLKESETIKAYYNRIIYDVPMNSILYIKAINSEVEIYTDSMVYRRDISMSDLEKELEGDRFFRCHRAYIINLDKAKLHNMKVMIKDIEIPVSRRKIKETEYAIISYSMKYK